MFLAQKVFRLALMAVILAWMGTSSLAEAVPNYYPKDYSKIIDASRTEKGLLIYSNMAKDNWNPILAAFNKHYPWIEVRTLDLRAAEVFARHIAEAQTGIATADFMVTISPNGWARMLEENRILRYPSPEIPYLPKWASRQETLYTFSGDPEVMGWNTKILPADMVPKGMADLAEKVRKKPDFFRARLTAYNETSPNGLFAVWGLARHHGENFWPWMDTIGSLTRAEQTGGAQLEKIISGEYLMSWNLGSITLATSTVKKAGKLIGWKYAEDGNIVLLRGLAIPAKAANPNSAKLLLDFILSQEGQAAMTKGNFTAYRPDAAEKVAEPRLHLQGLIKIVGEKNAVIIGWDPEYGDDAKFKAMRERMVQAFFGKKK
jgi:iron(III) transport system substrate-binding protein